MSENRPAKRFRVAFSFAGEKREFVSKVAEILAARFGEDKILYDKYHNAEFSRSDLAFYLPDLYEQEADLVVAVFCSDYEKKEWCGLEWNAIYGLLKKRDVDEVMLARFGHVEGKGLRGLAGYTDLDDMRPDQAVTEILERLALNEGRPKDHYSKTERLNAKSPSFAIPNNLPRLQPFFGRAEELKQIADALDPESRTWGALIDGPGGMGKTSLAVRAAYDCNPAQFQRIIFVSVKDREMDDEGERTHGNLLVPGFLEMLNEIARELGRADLAKSAEDQRIRLLLDALRPAQALLILDNLESIPKSDRDQLFTFVKRLPQGCKAILTSRRRIGSGSELVQLEKLDQDAALATLADLANHNKLLAKTSEAERLTLWKQTGGNPLLLRWVAGQLGRGSCRTFTDALHFLSTCPSENDPLEFIFGDLAREFTTEETKVLVALTYFSFTAKVEHIATVAGLVEAPVGIALDALANRSLVVPDQEETKYALVPMVAEFLRKHRPDVVRETGDQLEQRAYAMIVENGHLLYDRFPILDAAWPTVAPALPIFVAGTNSRLQPVCDAILDFLDFTGRWDVRLSLCEQAEAKALASGDHYNAGWRAYQGGAVYYKRCKVNEVLASAERSAAHWKAASAGTREQCAALQLRGLGHYLANNYKAAIADHNQELKLLRSLGSASEDIAIALNWLANAESLDGDLNSSERHYRESLGMARDGGYLMPISTAITNLAVLACEKSDWAAAEKLAREALPLAEGLGRQDQIAAICQTLTQALCKQGRQKEAVVYGEMALRIFTQLGLDSKIDKTREILKRCEE